MGLYKNPIYKLVNQYLLLRKFAWGLFLFTADDIKVGDRLLKVNDMSTEGLSADDVSDMMNALTGDVTLLVESCEPCDVNDSSPNAQSGSTSDLSAQAENTADVSHEFRIKIYMYINFFTKQEQNYANVWALFMQ